MSTTEDKIKELEAEYARTQKNKATETHLGLIKAKLAKLRRELETQGGKGGGGGGEGFDVKKVGDTRVGLVGFLRGQVHAADDAHGHQVRGRGARVHDATAIPGTMKYRGARIQVLDLPGIIEGAATGKGRGRQPVTHKFLIERELHNFGIRLNEEPPRVTIRKKDNGGVEFQWLCPQTQGMNTEVATRIMKEYRIMCASVTVREDISMDQFIDACDGKRTYIPCLYVMNKIDSITIEELDIIDELPNYVPISSRDNWNIDDLMENIWQQCNMMRVYTKPKGQVPDYDEPVVLHASNPTVEPCNRIHKAIMPLFKYAWVWGSSVRHQPQKVGKDHVLADEDVIQVIKRRRENAWHATTAVLGPPSDAPPAVCLSPGPQSRSRTLAKPAGSRRPATSGLDMAKGGPPALSQMGNTQVISDPPGASSARCFAAHFARTDGESAHRNVASHTKS
ncbi:GTP binding protein [Aureococcus anophagefferens]|nr:GTP binding protein [Aureococcus anophagefferens]